MGSMTVQRSSFEPGTSRFPVQRSTAVPYGPPIDVYLICLEVAKALSDIMTKCEKKIKYIEIENKIALWMYFYFNNIVFPIAITHDFLCIVFT